MTTTAQRFTDDEAVDLDELLEELAQRIASITDQQQRRVAIRNIGKGLYAIHRSTEVLHDLMHRTVAIAHDAENQLLPDFKASLDGIGGGAADHYGVDSNIRQLISLH